MKKKLMDALLEALRLTNIKTLGFYLNHWAGVKTRLPEKRIPHLEKRLDWLKARMKRR